MAETASVVIEKNGPVTTVILDRPNARNAVDAATACALAEAFLAFERDREASVAVFFGANGTFCAGADLKAIAQGTPNPRVPPKPENLQARLDANAPMGPSRFILSKPVIAAVAGHAVAGGMELALWCDMRVVEEDAVFGIFCRRFGVPLIDGGSVRLPRLIGHSRALDLILTGRPVGAEEALSMGLANRVVPNGTAREAAEALALDLTKFPQTALRNDRMVTYEQWDLPLGEALAREFEYGLATLASGEAAAGASSFALGSGRGGRF